jgi:hypothetical protein
LFLPEAMEAVEWVLRHFFSPNQPPQYRLIIVTVKHASAPAIEPIGPDTLIWSLLCEPVVDLIPSLRATQRDAMWRNIGGAPVLFVYTDASKEEEGAARVVDHATDLCSWARVNDAMFKAVERGRRWCDERRDGGGVAVADSTSTTMIHSSNGNPMATGSDLGLAFFIF